MRRAHPLEQAVGIDHYVSDEDGIGGHLKETASDFRVIELEDIDPEPLDADPAAYGHLVIRATLTGWDTYAFATRLARELGVHRDAIRWAGTKDRSAITTQLMSIPGVTPAELPSIENASIEAVGRFGRGLHFGDLVGNTFKIRVRNPTAPGHHRPITEALRQFGGDDREAVPNYFGPQRFGSIRPITHRVGLAILEEDWEAAVMTYLGQPTEYEPPDTQAARTYVEETRDWAGALERFPRALDHERRLLRRLSTASNTDSGTFRDALEALPRTLRELFVHAVQSYLFNRILSARLEADLPLTRAVEGDIVCFSRETETLGWVPDPTHAQSVTADRLDIMDRHIRRGRAHLTLPLVGSETALAAGAPGGIERDVLAEAGIEPSDFDLPEPYGSSGTRRAAVLRTSIEIEEDPLEFRFSLPSGSYATVVMREYLKVSPLDLG